MKVIKDYGVVACHGSKALKLQKISNLKKEEKLALVSYKDGMSISVTDITTEAPKLRELLESYLDYKTQKNETNVRKSIINSLTTLPAGDVNYQTTLREATVEELLKAIQKMELDKNGKHTTRINTCERAIKSKEKTTTKQKQVGTSSIVKEVEKEEKPKIPIFPTENKRPKIIPLIAKGSYTFEQCQEKLRKESEMFKDDDSQYVIEGLLEYARVDQDFRNNIMREDKTYGGFMEYMFEAAKNGYCIKYGNVGWISRDTGLELAFDYYNADTEKMKAEEEKKRKAETEKLKTQVSKTSKGGKKNGKNVRKKKGRVAG